MPDRWEDYSNIGSVVEGTRFLAFKVPLKAALLAQVELKHMLKLVPKSDPLPTSGFSRGEERLGCARPYHSLSHHITGC